MKKAFLITMMVLLSGTLVFGNDNPAQSEDFDCPHYAQLDDPPPLDGRKKGDGRHFKGMNKEDMKRWERLQLVKALELLDLDDEVETEFIQLFRKHKKEQHQYMDTRDSLIGSMAIGLRQDNISETKILETIKELNRLDSKRFEIMRGFMSKAESILTVEQLGKLYIFQARFGPEIFNKLKEFRRHGPGGPGGPGRFGNDSLRDGR